MEAIQPCSARDSNNRRTRTKLVFVGKMNWFDRLRAHVRSGQAGSGQTEGLVLSGGGSRASFHIGALRYLYDNCHISPTSITSTSAGSIVGAMLAQSLDPAEQLKNVRVLERYWLAMSDSSEMFTEQAWFTKLREQWDQIASVIPERDDSEFAFVDTDGSDAEHLVEEAIRTDPSTHSADFSLSLLWQALGSIPRLGKVGTGLAAIWRGAERAGSAYRPGPIIHKLLFESGFSAQAVRDSGMRLRMAFVGLQSGELRFMRQDGIIVDAEDRPIGTTAFDLPLGVWASCAIPGVFRPVKLGDDMYVDGGVRENLPVEMSVSRLGVTKPYVIVANAPGVPRVDFRDKDMVSVMMRALTIMFEETNRDEVEWARHAGATVIAPEIPVHGPRTVERGLLQINRDYGWMRAAEETSGPTGAHAASLPVVQARLALYDACKGDDDQARDQARTTLRGVLSETDPGILPEGYEEWPEETWD